MESRGKNERDLSARRRLRPLSEPQHPVRHRFHSFIHSFLLLDFFLYSLRLRGRLTTDMKTEASAAAVPFQGRSWLSCDWHSASADQSHATKVAFLTRFPNDVTT